MKRNLRRLFVFGLLALLVALAVRELPSWSARGLESRLSSFFHRPVSVGQVRFHLVPPEVEVRDVRVAGLTPEALPFLAVQRAVVGPSVSSLFGPRLVLSRLRIEGLALRVNAFPEGGDDIPRMGEGPGDGGEIRIRRLVLQGGEFVLDHARVPLDLDLPEFHGRLSAQRAGLLTGQISFAPGRLRFGDAPELVVGTDLDVTVDGPRITVESGHLRTDQTDLAYTGAFTIASRPRGEFRMQGPFSLAVLDEHVMRTGLGIQGDARWEGRAFLDGSRLRLKGHIEGTAGEFDGIPVPRFAGEVAWDAEGLHIHRLQVAALGGTGEVEVEVPPVPGFARLQATLRDVDAEALARAVFDLGPLDVQAAATGDLDLRWPRGRVRALSGHVALDLAAPGEDNPLADGRSPLSGRLEWRAENGLQFVERADLRTPSLGVRLEGTVDREDHVDLKVDADATDLATADVLGLRIRHAFGAAEARTIGLTGDGSFRGQWRGTLAAPIFEGRFRARRFGYLGVTWGSAEWAGRLDPRRVRSHSLILRRPGGELWLDGQAETGELGSDGDGLNLRLRFTNWPAQDFREALGWDLDVSALLSGEAAVNGRRSRPEGSVRVRAPGGRFYGVAFESLDVSSALRGEVVEVSSGEASIAGGTVKFDGTVTQDGVYDGKLTARDLEAGEILPPPVEGVVWGGRVSADLTLEGPLDHPHLSGSLRSPRLFLADEGVGALEAAFRGEGDGEIMIDGRCRSPRVDLVVDGHVNASPPYVGALRFAVRDTSLDPFARVVQPDLPDSVGIVATGEVTVGGPLETPRDLRLAVALSDLQVLFPDHPVRNPEPVRVSVDRGQLQLSRVVLAGEGTNLTLEGQADLLGDGPLALAVRGEADLRTLSAITRRVRGRGAARLALALSGTRTEPRLRGTLDLEGGGLRLRGFPHGLEGVRGQVRFTESSAEFAGIHGTMGGGAIEAGGQAVYAGGRLRSFDIDLAGRGVALRYPEGMRSTVDAELKLFGNDTQQWASGTVDVRQAVWTRRYDVASELLATGPEWAPAGGSLDDGLRYDIRVQAPGTLRIDNNLATLQARADLRLQGSSEAPILLGRVEVDRGRVYFQGNTYVIRRGTLDFADPQRIDPLFDVEAETRVRSYRITLRMNGTLARVYPTLTSDPPLDAVRILSLLAGADESAVASLAPSQTDRVQANLAATGAATLAAGRLAEEVGLEREAQRLFGLNRFSIDPSVVRGGVTNPTARLTVGKRLTPDLNVLYSVDLRGSEDTLLSLEYTLSDRFSLLLTRTDAGGFGVDVRLRQSR